jgi:hypothetical protein
VFFAGPTWWYSVFPATPQKLHACKTCVVKPNLINRPVSPRPISASWSRSCPISQNRREVTPPRRATSILRQFVTSRPERRDGASKLSHRREPPTPLPRRAQQTHPKGRVALDLLRNIGRFPSISGWALATARLAWKQRNVHALPFSGAAGPPRPGRSRAGRRRRSGYGPAPRPRRPPVGRPGWAR